MRKFINFCKRFLAISLVFVLTTYGAGLYALTVKVNAAPEIYGISAKAYVLLDETGDTLFEREADKRLPMASTTKVMTELIVSEHLDENEKIKIPRSAVGIEGSSAYLKEGEILTAGDLLHALLLQSANDAAIALSLTVCESVEDFCALMNEKAGNMGLKNTSFKNPHGLDQKDHYTTARDLAVIMQNALDDPLVSRIMATKKYACVSSEGVERVFVNHNKLLSVCEFCIGGKTGYTKADGRCLVSAAEKNGVRLIAVTLCAPNDWEDHKKLFAAGFDLYTEQKLCDAMEFDDTVKVSLDCNSSKQIKISNPITVYAFVRADMGIEVSFEKSELEAPVEKGETVGYAVFTQGKREVARAELVTLEAVKAPKKPQKQGFFEKIIGFFKKIF